MAGFLTANIVGMDENLPVTQHHEFVPTFVTSTLLLLSHSVYPFVDPNQHYTSQAFKGQVVLITGASRGIGQEAALQYARAGASLVLVSRKQETLDETRAVILKEVPGTEVVTIVADVKDPVSAEEAIKATKSRFGRLDVLVANAGATSPADKRGCFNDALRLKSWAYGLTVDQ
jgi:NADPH:quinone reductase-like Zn-dependent oxidoreductase